MSATIGTWVRFRISYIAAAASSSGTAIRTISQPASTISSICRIVPSTSVVSVLVIDCTATGAPAPIWTLPTMTARESRFINICVSSPTVREGSTRRLPNVEPLLTCRLPTLFRLEKSRNIQKQREHHQQKDHRQSRKLYLFPDRDRKRAAEPRHHLLDPKHHYL